MPSVVRIRLSLRGCINRPFYHIVVANSRWKRDGKHLEQVDLDLEISRDIKFAIFISNYK